MDAKRDHYYYHHRQRSDLLDISSNPTSYAQVDDNNSPLPSASPSAFSPSLPSLSALQQQQQQHRRRPLPKLLHPFTGPKNGRDTDLKHQQMVSTTTPIMSRSPSIASDSRFSALSGNTGTFPANPTNVQPAPAYVAPFGAVQVLTEHHLPNGNRPPDSDDGIGDALDVKPGKDDVSFTPAALALINAFLDQLLYSFLSAAKSTSLNALKPAVTDILKNKLARDAIASANEELSDLLAGNDEEDGKLAGGKDANSANNKWDLELVWKRTRLRVMVYMRLGEMEDEDEERHVKEQALHVSGEHSRFSSTAGLVSWSAAIFLTSVLEHVAEQTLQVAGSAAFARVRRHARSSDESADVPDQPMVIVDEQDAERIAVNPALGRLWRSWRKTVRANVRPTTPSQHREIAAIISPPKSLSSPRDSFGTAPESAHEDEADVADRLADHPPDTQYPEHILASNIRLPMGDALRDVDEIEVPGLARDPSDTGSDAGHDDTTITALSERRRSFSTYQSRQAEVQALSPSSVQEFAYARPNPNRRRSSSVPTTPRKSAVSVDKTKADISSSGTAIKMVNGARTPDAKPIAVEYDERDDSKAFFHDVDNRKSLIDIKTLLAAMDGGSALFGGASKDRQLETIEDRPTSSDSKHSFTLVDENTQRVPPQPIAERQFMDSVHPHDPSQIGVATTSDEAVVPERGPSAQGARSTPSPSHNLNQPSSISRARFSPALSDETKQAQSRPAAPDVSQRDMPIAPSERTLAALRESVHRASSPQAVQLNGVPKSASPDAQAHRISQVGQYGPISAFSNQAQFWEARRSTQPGLDASQVNQASVTHAASTSDLKKPTVEAPRDFDQLVQSEEVKKYTLTPDRIRETPKSDAQALAQLTGEVPPAVHHTSDKDNSDRRSGRSQVTKSVTAASTEDLTPAEKKRRRWSITKPLSRNTSAHRKSGMIAREARVITESTRDFADFIRSTKPDKEPEILPLSTNQSSTSLQSFRNSTNYSLPRSHSFNGDRTRSLTRSDIDAGHAPPVPSLPTKKTHMQPKSAKGNDKTGSSELIAFIRDGPKQADQHRISRTVAPFRTTMDSERFDEFKTSHPVRPESGIRTDGAGARQSVYSQKPTLPSTQASVSSRTPLTKGSSNADSVAHPAYSGKVQSLSALSSHPPDGSVERKQYRNKDPYAIDFMDDDDEDDILNEDVSALPRGKRGGESLAEFLRTAETSRDGELKPIASAASLAQARELRERARANNTNGNRRESYYSTVATSTQTGAVDSTSLPPASRGRASVNVQARPPTAGRAGERLGLNGNSSNTNTKDLADFLRNSGPAPAPAPAPSISRGVQNKQKPAGDAGKPKKSRGFFSFFRSKGSTG